MKWAVGGNVLSVDNNPASRTVSDILSLTYTSGVTTSTV